MSSPLLTETDMENHKHLQPILSLPQELVDKIVQYLSPKEKSFLSRTCRELYTKSIDSLYKNINMKWKCLKGIRARTNELLPEQRPRVDLLVRTLLESPRITTEILSLNLDSDAYKFYHSPNASNLLEIPLYVACILGSHIRTKGLKPEQFWDFGIKQCNGSACTAMLLWACPNLIELHLGNDFIYHNYYLRNILVSSDFRYQRLQRLTIGSARPNFRDFRKLFITRVLPETWRHSDCCFRISFLRFPALKDICLQYVKYSEQFELSVPLANGESTLTALRFHDFNISPTELGSILPYFPHVTTLDYVFNYPHINNNRLYQFDIDFTSLRSCLDSARGRLTHLKLCCPFWDHLILDRRSIIDAEVSHFSFKDLNSLESLETSFAMLGGWRFQGLKDKDSLLLDEIVEFVPSFWDRLPPQLQRLGLYEDVEVSRRTEWVWFCS